MKWTKSVAKLFPRSGLLTAILATVVSNFGIQAINIGTGIITARALGPDGRGSLAAMIMWPQFLAYLCTLGLPVASVYCIRRFPEREREFTGVTVLLCIVAGFVGSLIGFFIIPHSLHNYSRSDIHFAQAAVFLAPVPLLGIALSLQVQAAGRVSYFNIFRLLSPATILLVLVLELVFHRMTAQSAGLAYLLAGIPVLIWNVGWIWKRFRPRLTHGISAAKELLSYGLRAWGADVLGTMANQVDRLLIVGMLAPEAMGLYVVSQGAANVLNAVPSAVATVVMPKATVKSVEDNVALIGRSVRLTLALMAVFALPLLTVGGHLLRLVYGSKFLAAAVVLRFLVIETMLDGLTNVLAQGFLAAGQPGLVAILQGCGLFTAIPLLYLLIPRFGIEGAGIALMLSTLFRFIFVLCSYPIRLKSPIPKFIVGREEIALIMRRLQMQSEQTQ